MPKKLLTTTEAAEILGIDRAAVSALIRRGRLQAEKPGRDYLITEAALTAYQATRRRPGRPKKENP